MSVSGTGTPNCNVDSDSWQPVTNPAVYDVTALEITDVGSFTAEVTSGGSTLAVNRIGITMTGMLTADASVSSWMADPEDRPTVQLQDFIRVRNDTAAPPAP